MFDIKTRTTEALGVDAKIRKDAVLSVEFLLTASPEFFENESKSMNSEKLYAWVDENLKFLESTYGSKNVVNAVLHLDEKTPHLHVHVVPLTKEQKPRLNQKSVFGGPAELSKLQTAYASKMSRFGLKRGVERFLDKEHKKTHTTQAEYDRAVKQAIAVSGEKITVAKPVISKEDKSLTGFYSTDEVLTMMRTHGHRVARANLDKFAPLPGAIANELKIEREKVARLESEVVQNKASNKEFYKEMMKSKRAIEDLQNNNTDLTKKLDLLGSLWSKVPEVVKASISAVKAVVMPLKPVVEPVVEPPQLAPVKRGGMSM